jgi:hypothetical protein
VEVPNGLLLRILAVDSWKQLAPSPVIAGHDPQSSVVLHKGGCGSPRIAVRGRLVVARDDGMGTADSKGQSLRLIFRGRAYSKLRTTQA